MNDKNSEEVDYGHGISLQIVRFLYEEMNKKGAHREQNKNRVS